MTDSAAQAAQRRNEACLWLYHEDWEGEAEPFDEEALRPARRAREQIDGWVRGGVTLDAIAWAVLACRQADRRWPYFAKVLDGMAGNGWEPTPPPAPKQVGGADWKPDSAFEHLIKR